LAFFGFPCFLDRCRWRASRGGRDEDRRSGRAGATTCGTVEVVPAPAGFGNPDPELDGEVEVEDTVVTGVGDVAGGGAGCVAGGGGADAVDVVAGGIVGLDAEVVDVSVPVAEVLDVVVADVVVLEVPVVELSPDEVEVEVESADPSAASSGVVVPGGAVPVPSSAVVPGQAVPALVVATQPSANAGAAVRNAESANAAMAAATSATSVLPRITEPARLLEPLMCTGPRDVQAAGGAFARTLLTGSDCHNHPRPARQLQG
jgi:hypothetical protein